MAEASPRAELARARTVVLKIGSKTLASDAAVYRRLAIEIAALRSARRRFVIVSSGAIALGTEKLGLKSRPKEMAWLQAAAAAGQSVLMRHYEEAFAEEGMPVAQVLLTHADLADRTRGNNARAALAALLEANAVPIINENDTVAVDEIRFGDNDQLASMVVPLVDADLLLLLSDVAGVLNHDKERISRVDDIDTEALPYAGKSISGVGTGGMASKIEAARKATYAGAHVVVADARQAGIVSRIVAGEDVGTVFSPQKKRLSARRHWIAFTLRARGAFVLDAGAVDAVAKGKRSLLAVGVVGVRGDFRAGDAIDIVDATGRFIGRGLARTSAHEALVLVGKRSDDAGQEELVNRDDLVVLG